MSFARHAYTVIFYCALPMIALRLWWRGRKAPAYRERILERFGFIGHAIANSQAFKPNGIWIHAVSVGETIAATPLIRELQRRYPDRAITITTMTPTGSERVRALFGDSVVHVYAPYDVPDCLTRFLARVQPQLLVIIETELWPNTIHACAARNIPVILANARLSEKSARGYRRMRALTAPMLHEMTTVVAQNAIDGERFIELGLAHPRLIISGSIKFDISIDADVMARAHRTKSEWHVQHSIVWIAASTHDGEEEIILQAHQRLRQWYADALLILVPRHPERFNEIAGLIENNQFSYVRRSTKENIAADTAVLLGDTMGELQYLFGCVDMAFVGGSLISRGGHNMLEPAAWGLPIITGNSDFNFREISALLQQAGALASVQNVDELSEKLIAFSENHEMRDRCGAAALKVVNDNRGALIKLVAEITRVLN